MVRVMCGWETREEHSTDHVWENNEKTKEEM